MMQTQAPGLLYFFTERIYVFVIIVVVVVAVAVVITPSLGSSAATIGIIACSSRNFLTLILAQAVGYPPIPAPYATSSVAGYEPHDVTFHVCLR